MIKIGRKYLQLGPVLFAMFFLLVQVVADLSLPTLTAKIINEGIAKENLPYIWQMGGIMLAIAITGWLGAILNVYFASSQSQRLGMRLRQALFNKVSYMDTDNVAKFGNATLITRTTNDVTQLQNVFQTALRMMMMSPLLFIGAFIMAWRLDGRLTLVFAIALPILAFVTLINMRISIPRFKVMQEKVDRINLLFQQGLTGVRVIRAFNRDDYEITKFDDANRDLTHNAQVVFTTVAMLLPIMTVILSFTNIGIVWFGAKLIGAQMMPVGNLVAFLTYATQILMSFMQLSMVMVMIPRAQASAGRVSEILNTTDQITDPAVAEELTTAEVSLDFNNVTYQFAEAKRPALDSINLHVTSGQTLAIIGGTGAGKSTLINLIPRLIDPTVGSVILNGTNVKQLRQAEVHDLVAITQQSAVLFSGTVRSNMLFGRPEATDQMIWDALTIAQAADFVREQGGLDMNVEQDGVNFSGGQRQRIAIARTLIKDAAVYIFDDSFSALDFKTDALLRQSIKQESRLKSAIKVIVAQRVATVMDADQILILEHGMVVGLGSHRELMKDNQAYRTIMQSQLSEADLKEVGLNA